MKVGLLLDNCSPTDGGGYTFVTDLLIALHRMQGACSHELVLCHHHSGQQLAQSLPGFSAVNLDMRRANVISRREKLFKHLPELAERIYRRIFCLSRQPQWHDRIFEEEGIQFVFRLNNPWSAEATDTPFATVLWDLEHRNSPWFPEVSGLGEWELREANLSRLLRRASLIFTGTQAGRDEIVRYYQVPVERIKVLRFPTPAFALAGADVPKDQDCLRRLGVPSDYLFYPAQFWPHKNHNVVLAACKRIRETTGWDLGVVFTGSDKSNLAHVRTYARTVGLEHKTVFLNYVEQSDLVQLYKGAFCLAYPTFFGPDNLPPLEAFALGCPVVASAISGAAEQLGAAAMLFPPTDERALAEAVLQLCDETLRARMIEAGRARARTGSWDQYAQCIIEHFDEFARIRRAWP